MEFQSFFTNQLANWIPPALHTDVPLYKNFTQSNEMKAICKQLSFAHPVLFQSMLIFKSPKLGGEVTPHKVCDKTIFNLFITRPRLHS